MRRQRQDELGSARVKLDNLLTSISRGEEANDDDYYDDEHNGYQSTLKSKRSRGPRKSRKRVREDDYTRSTKCVLKLFDRSVDLAQFVNRYPESDPPLYPVCRAWILNDTSANDFLKNTESSMGEDSDSKSFSKDQGIYVLPVPHSRPVDQNGTEIDLRVPLNPKKELESSKIDTSINSIKDDAFDSVLEQNLSHWKSVRKGWKEAAKKNQERYSQSFQIIEAMSSANHSMAALPTSSTTMLDDDKLGFP